LLFVIIKNSNSVGISALFGSIYEKSQLHSEDSYVWLYNEDEKSWYIQNVIIITTLSTCVNLFLPFSTTNLLKFGTFFALERQNLLFWCFSEQNLIYVLCHKPKPSFEKWSQLHILFSKINHPLFSLQKL